MGNAGGRIGRNSKSRGGMNIGPHGGNKGPQGSRRRSFSRLVTKLTTATWGRATGVKGNPRFLARGENQIRNQYRQTNRNRPTSDVTADVVSLSRGGLRMSNAQRERWRSRGISVGDIHRTPDGRYGRTVTATYGWSNSRVQQKLHQVGREASRLIRNVQRQERSAASARKSKRNAARRAERGRSVRS